jgi:hypothetical protein
MNPTQPDPTGGQPIAPTQQTVAPAQAPLSVDDLQSLINTNAASTAQDIQNEPTIAAQQRALIFGNDPTLTSLQSNEQSKINELFEHDKMLAQNYGAPVNQPAPPNPNGIASTAPSSTGAPATLVQNPTNPQFGAENPLAAGYILNPYYAEQNMAQQDQTTMGELGTLENEAQQRRDVLGNVLDNVMKIYQSHLDTEKYLSDTYQTELNSKLQQQQDQAQNFLNAAQLMTGNTGVPPELASILGVPAGSEVTGEIPKIQAQFLTTTEGRKMFATSDLNGALSGGSKLTPQQALQKYAAYGLTADDVYQAFQDAGEGGAMSDAQWQRFGVTNSAVKAAGLGGVASGGMLAPAVETKLNSFLDSYYNTWATLSPEEKLNANDPRVKYLQNIKANIKGLLGHALSSSGRVTNFDLQNVEKELPPIAGDPDAWRLLPVIDEIPFLGYSNATGKAAVQSVKDYFSGAPSGGSGNTTTGGNIMLQSPTGQTYMWKAGDPEIQQALNAGYTPVGQ